VKQLSYLKDLLARYRPSSCLRWANQNLLLIPQHNTSFSRRVFSFTAPTVSNELPFTVWSQTHLATLTFDLAFRWAFCWAKVRSKYRLRPKL